MKSIRVLSTVVLAIVLVGGSEAAAQALRYEGEPGDAHVYTRTQQDHVIQTVNGVENETDVESFWRFSATVVNAADDGMIVRVVHDSIDIATTPALPDKPDFSSVYGQPVEVSLTDRGRVREVNVPDSLPEIAARLDFESAYRSFYPLLPVGDVTPGTSWADTTTVDTNQNGLDLSVTRVNTYTAGEMGSYAGRDARRIDFASEVTLEGGGVQGGNEIALSGTGSGGGTYWIQPDEGLFLGGEENGEVRMDAFVTAQGQNLLIPIVQSREETITLVE